MRTMCLVVKWTADAVGLVQHLYLRISPKVLASIFLMYEGADFFKNSFSKVFWPFIRRQTTTNAYCRLFQSKNPYLISLTKNVISTN
jgi:hypothetical protein